MKICAVQFGDSEIEVVDFEGVVAGERVIEFRFRDSPKISSFAAVVVPDGADWSSALLSIDPQSGDVSAALMVSLIEVARNLVIASASVLYSVDKQIPIDPTLAGWRLRWRRPHSTSSSHSRAVQPTDVHTCPVRRANRLRGVSA